MAPLLSSTRIVTLNAAVRKACDHHQPKVDSHELATGRNRFSISQTPALDSKVLLTLSSLRQPAAAEKSFLLK